ncbi:peptidylprolyl isomerase [Alteraurantiacibacter aquimixticola]|nr:peptidylprolyl isomerase [Alteraurantiacibacter aquimixticola]
MLQLFRNFFRSKLGIVVTLAFLGLIAFAFASSDVANTGTFGGVAGGDRVAVVGDTRIDTNELAQRASDVVANLRQDNPTLTMEAFMAQGGLQTTLDSLVSRAAIAEVARRYGLRAGNRLVDSEIAANPNLRGLDGQFSTESFRTFLRQQGISEDRFRDDVMMNLFVRQVINPVQMIPQLPASINRRYAELTAETRTGQVAALLAADYAPTGDPTDAQLKAYYEANTDNYIRPERRVVRYAMFGEEAFANLPAPTEEQIAERYEADALIYSERETRTFTQLIATTQAAAQAIVDEVNSGVSLEASARSKGLSTTPIPSTNKEDLADLTSDAVAGAAFAAREGALSAPAQGGLGWYVLRVNDVTRQPARSLAQVRDEISATLAAEQRRVAMNDATREIEDEFATGGSLSEVATRLGLEVQTTPPLTAAGRVYGSAETAPQVLAPIIPVAFQMEEAEPQLAEAVPGRVFIIYDVSDITRSAVAPLSDIREDVTLAWRAATGLDAAGEAAARVMERIEAGSTLADALRAEEKSIRAPNRVTLNRQQVDAAGGATREIALFFSMAEGTTRPLQSEETGAWFIVQLEDIEAPELADNSPVIAQTRQGLLPLVPQELTEQLIAALESEVEIEINDAAVEAVAAQLSGRTN